MPVFRHNMIKSSEIKKIVNDYSDVRIGVLGSHSALEVMDGAKDENFQTTVFCQKGREGPYQRFGRIAERGWQSRVDIERRIVSWRTETARNDPTDDYSTTSASESGFGSPTS